MVFWPPGNVGLPSPFLVNLLVFKIGPKFVPRYSHKDSKIIPKVLSTTSEFRDIWSVLVDVQRRHTPDESFVALRSCFNITASRDDGFNATFFSTETHHWSIIKPWLIILNRHLNMTSQPLPITTNHFECNDTQSSTAEVKQAMNHHNWW